MGSADVGRYNKDLHLADNVITLAITVTRIHILVIMSGHPCALARAISVDGSAFLPLDDPVLPFSSAH